MATHEIVPLRGMLSIDGEEIERDAHFPKRPEAGGEITVKVGGKTTRLRVERVERVTKGPEERLHVHATRLG